MSDKPENPPAFPTSGLLHAHGHEPISRDGMTLRDYFAAAALQAIIAKIPHAIVPEGDDHPLRIEAARGAYAYADVMLKERQEP